MSKALSKAMRDARNSLADLIEATEDILANRVEYLDESAEQAARELLESLGAVLRLHRARGAKRLSPDCPECVGDGVARRMIPFRPLRYSIGGVGHCYPRWRCNRCRCRFLDHGGELDLEYFPERG
jgi:hypothetical protein